VQMNAELQPVLPVAGNESELREVITNLIFNAVDALSQSGTITLRTYPEGEDVMLEVSDSGTGMTEEVRQRCLEPFFS
jgi:signal transduction histidine kinase